MKSPQALKKFLLLNFILGGFFVNTRVSVAEQNEANNRLSLARQKLFENISSLDGAPGSVIASPSREQPDYYFFWVRDAALVMNQVVNLYFSENNANEKTRLETLLKDYTSFSRKLQTTSNRSGTPADTGLGEPKFHVNGDAYNENWGRPQNDGPALRAITLTRFAVDMLNKGDEAYVRKTLYDGKIPTESVIKADLEFVAHHWQEKSFDLWEEVKGHHFYTRMVQRRSLLDGAKLADKLGDFKAAAFYRKTAKEIEVEIEKHWDASRGYIVVTRDPEGGNKASGLDVAVILGSLHGETPDEPFFSPYDDRILATAQRIRESFLNLYPVNRREKDDKGFRLEPGIGRYPEDTYNGFETTSLGNPWFLATAAMAELYYRSANLWQNDSSFPVNNRNRGLLETALSYEESGLNLSDVGNLDRKDARFSKVISGLRKMGDANMRRIKFHSPDTGSLSEEFNRDTGFMQGARDLTWNYASLLSACRESKSCEEILVLP